MITAPAPARVLREPLDDLRADPLHVVAAVEPAAGARRLAVLSGTWFGGGTVVTADPVDVVEAWAPAEVAAALARLDQDARDEEPLPRTERGDLLCVFTAGAYGFAMSSNYNNRPRAPEVPGPMSWSGVPSAFAHSSRQA